MIPFATLALLLFSCKTETELPPPSNNMDENPIVQSDPIYEVIVEEDILYAEGLSHQSVNSSNASTMALKLDIYSPDNDNENRPAFFFVHGGGFTGGSKQQSQIVHIGNYFASRGWVFYSIDYRLASDIGTLPQEWIDYSANLDQSVVAQFLAMYPANRDAKAALRWVVANAETYNINPDFISVGGGSAGAIIAITLGISNPEDYRDELSTTEDPTLTSTNLEQGFEVKTIIDFWGSKISLDALEEIYGHQRFETNDPPLLIVHGTEDPTVPFSKAEDLKAIYDANEIPLAYYPLDGVGHGAWNATVDNKRIEELAFDFIVETQALTLE